MSQEAHVSLPTTDVNESTEKEKSPLYKGLNSAEDLEMLAIEGQSFGTSAEAIAGTLGDSKAIDIESQSVVRTERVKSVNFSSKIPDNAPVILSWSNLTVKTKQANPKTLLDNINGQITGGFWAIMGASGGGKTTLLSTLSLRLDPSKMDISGAIRLNGQEYSRQDLKAMSAYVMQDDLLHAELTCAETLYYASQLRLPESFTDQQRKERVDACVTLMGIEHCKDVIVGDTRRKGISGGERKRLCIAIELLSKPRLLFLDEPTSGLDSSTAFTVCSALSQLAASGACTVICTIHQPQHKIFNLFDSLVLLKQGRIVYLGSCSKSIDFLDSVGLPCPAGTNPADHLLEIISPSKENEKIREMEQKVDDKRSQVPIDLEMGVNRGFFNKQDRADFIHQFRIIAVRSFLQYTRHPDTIALNFFSTMLIGFFIGGGIWHLQGNDQKAATTLAPSLFFTCVTQGIFGSLQVVNTFPSERAIMLRERSAGAYFVSAYYLAKSFVDMVTQVWPPILFSIVAYFMLGYTNTANQFFIYMAFMILDSLAATSLATAVSCWCVSVERATVALSFCFEVSRLYGGFFTSPAQLRDYPNWAWLDALSYIKYAFMAVALNELQDLEFTGCAQGQSKCIHNGNDIIAAKGYNEYTIGECAGVLICYIIATRFLGYIALRFIKV